MLRRSQPESFIHRAVVAQLQQRAACGVVWFHPANGGRRNIIDAVNLKRMGVVPGVSDIIAIHRGKSFALELKAKGGRPTESQLEFQDNFRRAGGHAVIAEGLDEAIRCLEYWGLLKGKSR